MLIACFEYKYLPQLYNAVFLTLVLSEQFPQDYI